MDCVCGYAGAVRIYKVKPIVTGNCQYPDI